MSPVICLFVLELLNFSHRIILGEYESWRDRVFTGVEEYTNEDNNAYKDYFRQWIDLYNSIKSEFLKYIPKELQDIALKMQSTLDKWIPPKLALNPSLRKNLVVSQEEFELIQSFRKMD